jgi:hypothetical protein
LLQISDAPDVPPALPVGSLFSPAYIVLSDGTRAGSPAKAPLEHISRGAGVCFSTLVLRLL